MIFHLPALRTPQKTPASLSPAISRLPSRHPSISLGPLPRSLIAWLRIGVDEQNRLVRLALVLGAITLDEHASPQRGGSADGWQAY